MTGHIVRPVLVLISMRNAAGAQMVGVQVAESIIASGREALVCFLYDSNPAFEARDHIVTLFPSKPRKVSDFLRILIRLVRLMFRVRPAAVHTILPLANVLGAAIALIAGVPRRVASLHYPAHTQGRAIGLVDRLWGAMGIYTSVVACSEFVAGTLKDYPRAYRRRVKVIPNGVEPRLPSAAKAVLRRKFGLRDDAFIVGSVGRISAQKNQQLLIEAAGRVPDVHLAIVGTGDLTPELEATVAKLDMGDRFTFVGALAPEQVPDFLGALDLYVLPSIYEGLPLSVLEAMHAGVPVLGSDIPSIREIAEDAEGGLSAMLLPLEPQARWVSALERAKSDPLLLRDLRRKGLERVRAFTPERMLRAYADQLC